MGMGHAGASADVIEEDKLVNLLPKEFQALMDSVDQSEHFGGIAHLAFELQAADGTKGIADKAVLDALNALCDAFARRFEGLTLTLRHHDPENGGRYDDVNGAYWSIGGLYILSRGAKQLGTANFERKHFVEFG